MAKLGDMKVKYEFDGPLHWISVEDVTPSIYQMVLFNGGCGYWTGREWRQVLVGRDLPVIGVAFWAVPPSPPISKQPECSQDEVIELLTTLVEQSADTHDLLFKLLKQ